MKNTVKKDLQTKTIEELKKLLTDARKALLDLKLDKEQNKLKNTSELSWKRKEIAVLQTIMNIKKTVEAKAVADKGGKE